MYAEEGTTRGRVWGQGRERRNYPGYGDRSRPPSDLLLTTQTELLSGTGSFGVWDWCRVGIEENQGPVTSGDQRYKRDGDPTSGLLYEWSGLWNSQVGPKLATVGPKGSKEGRPVYSLCFTPVRRAFLSSPKRTTHTLLSLSVRGRLRRIV